MSQDFNQLRWAETWYRLASWHHTKATTANTDFSKAQHLKRAKECLTQGDRCFSNWQHKVNVPVDDEAKLKYTSVLARQIIAQNPDRLLDQEDVYQWAVNTAIDLLLTVPQWWNGAYTLALTEFLIDYLKVEDVK